MKTAELKATIREHTGAKNAIKLRKNDKIPAVVYGASGVQHVEIDYLPMAKLIKSPELFLINLDSGKTQTRVIIQDAQFHPVTDKIIHVDFLEAAVGKSAKLNIPVNIIGKSIGVMNGGQLVVKMRHVHVQGIPAELPEHIDVDISDLQIGKSIKVGDIKGYDLLDPDNAVIVRVKTARNIEELLAPAAETEEGEEAEGEEGEEGEGKEGEEGEENAPAAKGKEDSKEKSE